MERWCEGKPSFLSRFLPTGDLVLYTPLSWIRLRDKLPRGRLSGPKALRRSVAVLVRNILPQGVAILLIVLLFCASTARADEAIELSPGIVKLLRFDRPVGTVAVGNPAVADTFAPNDRAILLTGKTIGSTNLIVLDDGGRDLFSAAVIVSRTELGRVTVHSK